LRQLSSDGIGILLVEQNLGVAIEVADRIGVMVNGRIAHELPAGELAADEGLQQRLLGVRANGDEEEIAAPVDQESRVLTGLREQGDVAPLRPVTTPNRWDQGSSFPRRREPRALQEEKPSIAAPIENVIPLPLAPHRAAYVAGTFDTKSRELTYLRQCLERRG